MADTHKKKFNFKLFFRSTLLFVLIGVVGVALITAAKNGWDFISKPQFEDDDDVVQYESLDPVDKKSGKLTMLLAGTDAGGSRTDTIMVAVYHLDEGKVDILSIPRDTRVLINGKYRKINSANVYGGTDLLIQTIRDTFGIGINYYAVITNTGFVEVIDALGGVDFDEPHDMDYDDPVQDLHIHLKKGMQHLDGKQAEGVVRWRKNNTGSSGGDVPRVKTQQAFIKALVEQKLTLSNIGKIDEIYKVLSEHLNTNVTIKDVLGLVPNLKELDTNNVNMYLLPGDGKTISGASFFLYEQEEAQRIIREDMGLTNAVVKPCNTGK